MHTFTLFITFITATHIHCLLANRIVISPAYLYFPPCIIILLNGENGRDTEKEKNIWQKYIYYFALIWVYYMWSNRNKNLFTTVSLFICADRATNYNFVLLFAFVDDVALAKLATDPLQLQEKSIKKIPWKYRVLMVCVDTKSSIRNV